jgi:DNA-binding transcriptional ArsR family regulator
MKTRAYGLFFRALGNPTRQRMIASLREGPKNVGRLCAELGLEQSRVSHSLRMLEAWGFVSSARSGKNVVYSLDSGRIGPILDGIDAYMGEYEKKLCTCGILKGGKTCQHLKEGKEDG